MPQDVSDIGRRREECDWRFIRDAPSISDQRKADAGGKDLV